ncbi:MAG: amidoligase family protein [Thermoguttaceae bacterium]|nr:amidoligase family protein [Thermoguttaceae bacterium]
MNANDLTFGLEIETIINRETANANGLNVGRYHDGRQVPYLPEGWTAASDSSIRGNANETGCEIVSPILRGEDGLRQIYTVLAALKEKGHRVNTSTGVHVHIGYGNQPEEQVRRLVAVVAYLETAIYATTGTKNRERGGWCKGIRRHENVRKAVQNMNGDRYHLLNITNLRRRRIPTIEFRAFSGSLNPVKILGWVQMCLGVVERGLTTKRLPVWKSKTAVGGWRKPGVGQTDVERCFGFLGWGRGYRRLKGGHMYGWLTDLVPQDEIKKEFRRLAKKYDAEN